VSVNTKVACRVQTFCPLEAGPLQECEHFVRGVKPLQQEDVPHAANAARLRETA